MPSLSQRLRQKKTAQRSPLKTKVDKGMTVEQLTNLIEDVANTRLNAFKEEMKTEIEPWLNELIETILLNQLKGPEGKPGKPGTVSRELIDSIRKEAAEMVDKTAEERIPRIGDIVAMVIGKLPIPEDGKPGERGRDADEAAIEKRLDRKYLPLVKALALAEELKKEIAELKRRPTSSTSYGAIHRGGGIKFITATGTIDDSNTTFTFSQIPKAVIVNGAVFEDGNNVTITGTTAELDNAVGTGGSIVGII